MKKTIKYYLTVIVLMVVTVLTGCQKEKKATVPILSTSPVSSITATSSTSGGNITDDGGATVTTHGICWSVGITPTIADNKTSDGSGAGSFSSIIEGLNGGAIYYVRAYATNIAGTGYGMALSFTTLGQAPVPAGATVTNINTISATLNGSVNANYLSTVVTFEYGTSTSYGSTATPSQSPLTGNTNTNVSAAITGLTAGTIYHYRIKAVNSLGTTNSNDYTFTTLGLIPTVTTLAATNINVTSASLNGTVNANFISTVVTFEYGTTTIYGSTATATQSPVTGSANTNVSASITGLIEGTIYHFRIKAINSLGTSYGSDLTFTTTPSTTVTDVDGNTYNKVTIGTQVWMKENLKTTKYNDGTAIPNITDNTIWEASTTGAYSNYINTPSYSILYGRLYNWFTVDNNATTKVASNGGKNVCPTNWHIPTDAEWTTLITYLGGSSVAGGKLKEAGTTHWLTPNTEATNETGFTALPSGARNRDGSYYVIGQSGSWWSSTEFSNWSAFSRSMYWNNALVSYSNQWPAFGFSVRCLKDL